MRPAIPNRVQLQLRLDKTLHAKLTEIAKREERPLNTQISYFCARAVANYERENGPVEVHVKED